MLLLKKGYNDENTKLVKYKEQPPRCKDPVLACVSSKTPQVVVIGG